MHVKVNRYPRARLMVAVITLNPHDILPGYSDGSVVGGYLVYGSACALVDGVKGEESSKLGWTAVTEDGPWLDAWEDRAKVKGRGQLQAGADGAQWVCVSAMGWRPAVVPHELTGIFTVPAKQRVVVARGIVEYDGQQGEQGNLFAPRNPDTDIKGSASLLLLS